MHFTSSITLTIAVLALVTSATPVTTAAPDPRTTHHVSAAHMKAAAGYHANHQVGSGHKKAAVHHNTSHVATANGHKKAAASVTRKVSDGGRRTKAAHGDKDASLLFACTGLYGKSLFTR